MIRRITILGVIAAAMLTLPGCPGGVPSALVGSWVITISGLDYGVTLNADGTASSFQLDSSFQGALTWQGIDGGVLIFQTLNATRWVSAGALTSATTISGSRVEFSGGGSTMANTFTGEMI